MEAKDHARQGLDELLTVTELATYLGVPVKTVYAWRHTGTGPRAIKIGKYVKFAVSDIRVWLDAQRDDDGPTTVKAR